MRLTAFATVSACALASLALSACDRSDPPSEKMRDAMVGAVETVAGEEAPPLAEGRYAPRDECADIDGVAQFRARLETAIEDRNAQALAALASPAVRLDFGGGSGRDTLTDRLEAPEGTLWDELDQIVALGCARSEGGGIVLPWHFAQSLDVSDPYMAMLVTGERIPLHRAASQSSEVLESISWDTVELVDGLRPEEPFQHVTAPGGTVGYIATDDLRSLLAHRLLANEVESRWQITALVAGD